VAHDPRARANYLRDDIRWFGIRKVAELQSFQESPRGDFMDIKEPIVLLVGKNLSGALRLVEWLRRLGCGSHIVASYQEARTMLETRRFDVVLSETDLPDGNAYGLISTVTGSPTSLFFCLAVEDSYWWLPAVTQGRECLGAPALRPAEFARALWRAGTFKQL